MKKLSLATIVVVFLLVFTNGIQGQTTQLDQIKLMNGLVGTWQTVLNKDTTEIAEIQQYEGAYLDHVYYVINGKKSLNMVNVFCFDPNEGKFKGFGVLTNGAYATFTLSFVDEKKLNLVVGKDFNPDIVYYKTETTMVTPTSQMIIMYNPQGIKTGEVKSTKIK